MPPSVIKYINPFAKLLCTWYVCHPLHFKILVVRLFGVILFSTHAYAVIVTPQNSEF
jgi:hypothetical protein